MSESDIVADDDNNGNTVVDNIQRPSISEEVSSDEESHRSVKTNETDITIINEVSVNQFFYRGKIANTERVFSPVPKRRKKKQPRRPITFDPRSNNKKQASNNSNNNNRPATAPINWGFSKKERKKQQQRPIFSNSDKESFAEYQRRNVNKKNPYLSAPCAEPKLVDIGQTQKDFYTERESSNISNNTSNFQSMEQNLYENIMSAQVPETMRTSLSKIKKKTKRVDEDRQVAKKQLFEDMVAIRDTLPLDFLFEHNLNGFVVERGMRKARKILERIRNKAILAGFDHWVKWNIKAREEEKEEEMRQFALAHGQEKLKQFLLNFLHNKISGGFKKWRHFVELCVEQERINAACTLQLAYRSRKLRHLLYRRRLIRFERKVIMLQRKWRCVLARKIIKNKLRRKHEIEASLIIQRIFRGYLGRRKMINRRLYLRWKIIQHIAAICLQRVVRGRIGRRKYRETLILRNAARKIQAIFRGRRGREAARKFREEYLDNVMEAINFMLESAERNNAAASIQDVFRHYQIRKFVLTITETIDDSTASMKLLMEEAERHVAAIKIQNAFQSFSIAQMMKNIAASIMARVDRSARILQQFMRRLYGQRMVRLWKEQFILETNMALRLQARIRGRFGRKYAQQEYNTKKNLVMKVSQRFHDRKRARLRRRVLLRWRENQYAIFIPNLYAWKNVTNAIRNSRKARADLKLHTKAIVHMCKKKKKIAIHAWTVYVAEELRIRALMRKAYMYWSSLIKASAFRSWREVTEYNIDYRKKLARRVFLSCAALETWNSFDQIPKVKKANAIRIRETFKVMKMFLFWRRERIQMAIDFYKEKYWLWDAMISFELLDRYERHRKVMKRNKALALKWENRYNRKKRLRHWIQYWERRKFFYSLKEKGDRHFFNVHGTKHFHAWHKEIKRVLQLKKLARRAMNHWKNATLVETWDRWSKKAKRRGIMRKTILFMSRTRYLRPNLAKWRSQAKKVKDALEFRSAQAIQKIFRKILAQTLAEQMRAKNKYLFDIRVKREKDVLKLTPYNASSEMKKFHMVFVHFFAPWSETASEKKEFATAASTMVDLAGRKLNFGRMAQVVEEVDEWTRQPIFRVNERVQFAKIDATEEDPNDYGRSLGVRFKVMKIPGLRLYWRYGRRGGKKLKQPEPDEIFDWVQEDYTGKFNAGDIMTFLQEKLDKLNYIELPRMINIQRIARGWYARKVIVRAAAAGDYWEKEPLWVRKKDRQGNVFYLNRITGAISFDRPNGYETPRGEPVVKKKLGSLLTAMEDGTLPPDDPAWGVPSPLKFKQAALCMVCENDLATWKCLDACDVPMCDDCMEESHLTGSYQSHRIVSCNIQALHANKQMCGTCEVRLAQMACKECEDTYCMECYQLGHLKGRMQYHKYVLVEERKQFKKSAGTHNKAHNIIKRRGWKTIQQFQIEHAAKEAAAAAKKARMDNMREVVKKAFERYDADNSGSIDINEVSEMMREELHEPIDGKDLEDCMAEMDKDGNGVIDFEEFLDWFTSDSVYGRKASKFLKLMRFKMRIEANGLKTARVVAKVTGNAMMKGIDKLSKGIDKIIEVKKQVDEKYDAAKNAAYENFVPENIKEMIEHPLVPGTAVGPIDHRAFKEKKDVFVRWCREEFLIDVPPADWLEDDKAVDAFEEVFIPAWNSGRLKLRHYHDGRIFKHDDARWKQVWVPEIMEYRYHNLKTKEIERLDPQWFDLCEEKAEKAFEEFDKDGSGELNEKELKALLNWELCKPVRTKNVQRLLVEMDQNGDGKIDFEEFLPWYAEQTNPNGNNGEFVRAVEQRALELALQSRKNTVKGSKAAVAATKAAAAAVQNKVHDKYFADETFLKLVHELRYDRDAVTKATAINNKDFDRSLAWLIAKGHEPIPELTEAEKEAKRKASIQYRTKQAAKRAISKSRFASKLFKKIGLGRMVDPSVLEEQKNIYDDEDDY